MTRVLVVDDQPTLRRLVAMSLDRHEVIEADDVESAWAIAVAEKPEVILLDVMMPGALTGLDLCSRIRAHPPLAGCKIVLLSARAQRDDQAAGLAAGADAYVTKPFSPAYLASVVNKLADAARRGE